MDIVTVDVGIDYHSSSARVCVMDQEGISLVNRSVESSVDAVIELIQSVAQEVQVAGVALEACTGSAEFAARLHLRTAWKVRLAHAGAVHRLKQGPDKTDHGDAWHLANLLRVNYLPEVWLADEQTRQLRHLVRHRQALMADAKDIKLRIRSLLKEDCIEETCPTQAWTKSWLSWLGEVEVPEQSRWIIQEQLSWLTELARKIDAVEQRLQYLTQEDPVVQKLLDQPGIGLVTAVLLRAVIGRFGRFRSGKQLARYCGVTPCNASSGQRQADAGLIQAGHDDLRAALIQLAKRLPRHGCTMRWFQAHGAPKANKRRDKRFTPEEAGMFQGDFLERLNHDPGGVENRSTPGTCVAKVSSCATWAEASPSVDRKGSLRKLETPTRARPTANARIEDWDSRRRSTRSTLHLTSDDLS
jgi:transposase